MKKENAFKIRRKTFRSPPSWLVLAADWIAAGNEISFMGRAFHIFFDVYEWRHQIIPRQTFLLHENGAIYDAKIQHQNQQTSALIFFLLFPSKSFLGLQGRVALFRRCLH